MDKKKDLLCKMGDYFIVFLFDCWMNILYPRANYIVYVLNHFRYVLVKKDMS